MEKLLAASVRMYCPQCREPLLAELLIIAENDAVYAQGDCKGCKVTARAEVPHMEIALALQSGRLAPDPDVEIRTSAQGDDLADLEPASRYKM